ncbi:MAG: hypothetical protein RBT45_08530 [Acholeplasmataceae bacterium]|jgi:hypothetical protein|nr:hypothetical protein [Acholeplasmataceae bacterium]
MLVEKVILIYERDSGDIACFLQVFEIDMGYITNKLVAYYDERIETLLFTVLDDLRVGKVNIRTLRNKLDYALKNHVKWANYLTSHEFPLFSGIKGNRTVRDKRILKAIGKKDFRRAVKDVGIA